MSQNRHEHTRVTADEDWDYPSPDGEQQNWRYPDYWVKSLPQAPTEFGFTSLYNSKDPMDRRRKDAFYEWQPTEAARGDAPVMLTFQAEMCPKQPTRTGAEQNTAMLSVRLMFPAHLGDRNAFGWKDVTRRDEIARWIDTRLGTLCSRGILSGCIAGGSFQSYDLLMQGRGSTFRLQLGSLLRDPDPLSVRDSPSNSANNPSASEPFGNIRKTTERIIMKLWTRNSTLRIREAAEGTDSTNWQEGQYFDDLETQLKPVPSKAVTYDTTKYRNLKPKIQKSIDDESYRTNSARCVFGNVVVCGPDVEETIGKPKSNTAAAS